MSLDHVLAGDVIRYWLATLAFQEALATRPRARRTAGVTSDAINVEEPMAGQDYAKLQCFPGRGQLERLWRELRELRIPVERPQEILELEGGDGPRAPERGLGVGTVHRFQGGERSIILFTTTVTEQRSLPFVDARVNLVNVAASRARDHLVTVGHTSTLRAGRHTRHLVEQAIPFTLCE